MNPEKAEKPVIRWLDYVFNAWPLFASLVLFVSFVSGRLETSEAKIRRIRIETRPIISDLTRVEKALQKLDEELDRHKDLSAHAVMDARMDALEREVNELRRKLHE